jgi:hypothetical protein
MYPVEKLQSLPVITGFVLNPEDGPFSVFAWVKGGAPDQAVLSQMGWAK